MIKNTILGDRIKERRKQLKLTQTQLAEKVGYSDKTGISKIENHFVDLPQSKIIIFADALETSPQYLMGWTEDPEWRARPVQTGQTTDEIFLLSYFRQLTPEDQKVVMRFVKAMVKEHAGI